MDLQTKNKNLIGQAIGIADNVYSDWSGSVLRGVAPSDAAELLSLPDWQQAGATTPKAKAAVAKAPEPEPEPAAEEEEEEEGYSREELVKMRVADLLEFVDEADLAKAKKMNKEALIAFILEDED